MITEKKIVISEFRNLVHKDFEAMNQLIQTKLSSNVELIAQISHHIINSGGKRLRPLLVLLTTGACEPLGGTPILGHHISLAAIIEFLHTATLLHDDVVDTSTQRRGKKTANAIWGNQASILVGDYLYSRAFQMMSDLNNMHIIRVLSDATNLIAAGEVMQLMHCKNPDAHEQKYMEIIELKTAKLFEVSCQLGAIATMCSGTIEHAMAKFGLYFGIAYQIIDDVLDFSASPEELGKNLGDDLAEGKPTLPLIYAMNNGNNSEKTLIQNAILNCEIKQLDVILEIIYKTAALDYAKKLAEKYIDSALKELIDIPDSSYRNALIELAHFAVERKS